MENKRFTLATRDPCAVDGTFCQAALKGKIHIKEQLPKYIGSSVQLCILLSMFSDHCVTWAVGRSCSLDLIAYTIGKEAWIDVSLMNQTISLGWCLSIKDYKCPVRKGCLCLIDKCHPEEKVWFERPKIGVVLHSQIAFSFIWHQK